MPRPPGGAQWLRRAVAWLPAVVSLPFLALYLVTAAGRLATPFELEWNEGHTAEQAIRFALREPLYPAPSTGWVPYMYAPLYHMLLGLVFKLTGSAALGWGRAISLAASIATACIAGRIVWEETRRREAALCAAGLAAYWFRASGCWHDLVRVDSLGQALAIAGVWLLLGRGSGPWRWFWGTMVLAAAAFTKQPMAVAAVVTLPACLWLNGRRVVFPIAAALLLAANALKYFIDAGNTHFLHYAVGNASAHASWWAQLIPGGARPVEFFAGLGPVDSMARYAAAWQEAPPAVWREAGRHVWMPLAALGAALVAVLRRRRARLVRLAPHLLTLAAMGAVCVLGYIKFGGYVNNFMPMHLWLAVCLPIAWCAVRRLGRPPVADAAFATILILQAWQPGSAGGLLWSPASQWPNAEDRRAHGTMMRWLADRHQAGERVLVVHHQYYGYLTGHGLATNVDMVRCAQWAGDPVPAPLNEVFSSGRYEWLVLDQGDPEEDWLPVGFAGLVVELYEPAGPVPGLVGEDGRWLMVPRTGAPVRPGYLFRRRTVRLGVIPPPDP